MFNPLDRETIKQTILNYNDSDFGYQKLIELIIDKVIEDTSPTDDSNDLHGTVAGVVACMTCDLVTRD